MRYYGNDTALLLKIGDYIMHTVEGSRESRANKFEPIFLLVLHLLVIKSDLILKKGYNARIEILDYEALKGLVVHKLGSEILEILYK